MFKVKSGMAGCQRHRPQEAAAEPHVSWASFDLVFLCTAFGEIADRAAALRQCNRALEAGGVLPVTEVFSDLHYQSRSVARHLAEGAGF
jgi:ubiquinone/menaquinone biosynthesis C-methylase UbiE